MFALCIESSHSKGMGHLFRCLNFIACLVAKGEPYLVLINNHAPSINLLKEKGIAFQVVDLDDLESDWETGIILKESVRVWVNDRLDTDIRHAENVKKNNVILATFDDKGSGACRHDLHFAGLFFENDSRLKGGKIFSGVDYLILNQEIARYQRVRTQNQEILVSMGGSDTYGVTLKVVDILQKLDQPAKIHIGPSFEHVLSLKNLAGNDFQIIENVPSLIQLFSAFDLAITGGGVTPFEANASGLPCVIIANEIFEEPNGKFLEANGSSVFACHHEKLSKDILSRALLLNDHDIESMSRQGIKTISTDAAERIYRIIKDAS